MSLYYLPTTTCKVEYWSNQITKYVSTLTANDHQKFINKTFSIVDTIYNTTKYSTYKTDNVFILSGPDIGFSNVIFFMIVDNHNTINDGRSDFLDIDA